MQRLEYLDLGFNQLINDQLLGELAGLINLKTLRLAVTAITDAGSEKLLALRSLTTLELRNTRVTAAAAQQLQSANPALKVQR